MHTDPIATIEFLLEMNNITLADGEKYYILYMNNTSAHIFVNAGY